MFRDSQGGIALAKNLVHHNALKHIEVQYHLVWDNMPKGKLGLVKLSTANNVEDGMTKSLLAD